MDERKYSTISTGSKVLLGVPGGNNPDSTATRKAAKDLGMNIGVKMCIKYLNRILGFSIIIDNKTISFSMIYKKFQIKTKGKNND